MSNNYVRGGGGGGGQQDHYINDVQGGLRPLLIVSGEIYVASDCLSGGCGHYIPQKQRMLFRHFDWVLLHLI